MEVICRKSPFTRDCEFPFQIALGRIHGVKVAVPAAEVHYAARNRRRRGDPAFGFQFPSVRAVVTIQRVYKMLAAPAVSGVGGHVGRRLPLPASMKLPLDLR